MAYKRVLLKLSGEALKGSGDELLDIKKIEEVATIIKAIQDKDIELGIVIGGGNIIRGRISEKYNLDRVPADFMGMLSTNINAIMLENLLSKFNVNAKAYSCLPVDKVLPKIKKSQINKDLKNKVAVIFGGGTGRPFVSTDSGSSLRAKEYNFDVILAGKNGVDGVYDKDPKTNSDAKFYKTISFDEVINKNLQVFDIDAIKVCKENNIHIKIFNMNDLNNILKVIDGTDIGSTIGKE